LQVFHFSLCLYAASMQQTILLPEVTTKAKLKHILPKTKPLCKHATEVSTEYVAYLQHNNSIYSR